MQRASKEYNYDLKLHEVASIWRGGCIIRSALLEDILSAYSEEPGLPNLMVDKDFALKLDTMPGRIQACIKTAVDTGVPATCNDGVTGVL